MSGSERNREHGKWNAAIGALLAERSHEDAARKLGIASSTLRRWLSDPNFQRLYRDSRTRALEQAISRLTASTVEAVDVLRRNFHDDNHSIQVRSAIAVLEIAIKGMEIIDVENRLASLEEYVARAEGNETIPAEN